MRRIQILAVLPLFLVACESKNGETGGTGGTTATTTTTDTPTATAADFGHCTYTNKFSKSEECREYQGSKWTTDLVAEDCASQDGVLSEGACSYPSTLGTCILDKDPEQTTIIVSPGDDPAKCQGLKVGCETFGGGTFKPDAPCNGDTPVDPNASVFQPPEQICKDPLPGEPAGQSAGGKVCTWTAVGGCTEPGRKYTEYASCDPVYTQRPYYPVDPSPPPAEPDPRLQDPNYVAELGWVKEQVEACACVCCHQNSVAPKGASIWDIDATGNWADTFTPYGLAFAGGFMPSWPLGAYPPEQNNGFQRDTPDVPSTGIPSTDPARLAAFFKGELEHRGESVDTYAGYDPQPGIFYDQVKYVPKACDAGIGVGADGTIAWSGGPARYVYVLEAGSNNPGVPPNLDMPAGTVWRIDVRPDQTPVKTKELVFGKVPASAKQAFPADGSTPTLTKKSYYLYVLADVGIPITRCLFDYAGP